jgi:ABC-type antimicrobial peptide transport system permease subunit
VKTSRKRHSGKGAVKSVTTLDALVGNTILAERLVAAVGAAFAFLGLVLAAIGVFGLLNYTVTRRTKELGIRAALGARRWSLCRLMVNEVTRTMAGGLVVGLVGFIIAMRFAEEILFDVGPADPLVIGRQLSSSSE